MPGNLSRRNLLAGSAAVGAGLLGVKSAQASQKPDLAGSVKAVESQLAEPLNSESAKLLPDAVAEIQMTSKARLRHKLPENSEPSMIFKAMPKEVRGW